MQTTPYVAVPNSFRQRLIAGERLIGCWCSMASPIVAEVLGLTGNERVAGFIYLGTPAAALEDRPRPALDTVVTAWG